MNKYTLAMVALLAGAATVLLEIQASPASSAAANAINQLDGLKAQFLPPEYRNANISIDDIKRVYQEKCRKVTGRDNSTLYQEIEKGAAKLGNCLSSLANLTELQAEMEAARPVGDLDTVFHKYCQRAPQAEQCVHDFNVLLQPCLTEGEKQQQATMLRILSSLLGFACSRGGDQLALFVAEQGPECLEANKESITHCMNVSFHQYMPKDGTVPDLMSQPELLFTPTHCGDMQSFESCVLHHLEQCSEITPANIVQSVFRFIKNETNCQAFIDARANQRPVLLSGNGTASALAVPTAMLAPVLGLLALNF